jgi:hypothetical protein
MGEGISGLSSQEDILNYLPLACGKTQDEYTLLI